MRYPIGLPHWLLSDTIDQTEGIGVGTQSFHNQGTAMLDWFRRLFLGSQEKQRKQFFETIDALNAEAGSGEPTSIERFLGTLPLRSGTLILGDPQYMPALEVPNIDVSEAQISAQIRSYPSQETCLTALTIKLGDEVGIDSRSTIGEVGIDSAKLVVADKVEFEEHWTDVGKDRLGVIITARNDAVLRMLTKRFKLKTRQVNRIRAEVQGPVSESLENEIEGLLNSMPDYADFPYMHRCARTQPQLSIKANRMTRSWEFMPVGNADEPLMFVCETGRGDGAYKVQGEFLGDVPKALSIMFIGDVEN